MGGAPVIISPMPLRLVRKAVLFALGLLPCGLAIFSQGSEKTDTKSTAPVPVVWRMESAVKVGDHSPEVLGSPQVIEDGGLKALVFDGRNDGLILPVNPIAGWSRFTIEVLIKPALAGAEEQRFIHIQDTQGRRVMVELRMTRDHQWVLDTYLRASTDHNRTLIDRAKTHPADQWHWVALVYDGEVMTNYINGVKELDGGVLLPPMVDGGISIGVRQNKVSWYKGAICEIRFYPGALKPAALQRIGIK